MHQFLKNLQKCCAENPLFHRFEKIFNDYTCVENLSHDNCKNIIDKLCFCILTNSECGQHVAEHFPQLLIMLLSMTMPTKSHGTSTVQLDADVHRLNCVILGRLISLNLDVLSFAMRYFETHPAPFELIIKAPPAKKLKKRQEIFKNIDIYDYDIVVSTYRLLSAAPNQFKHKWNWSQFYNNLIHENIEVQWIALKCISIILEMSESTMISCAKIFITDYKKFLLHRETTLFDCALAIGDNNIELWQELVEDTNSLVSIAGVILPMFNKCARESTSLISVPSMLLNLRALALAVASRKCVCLQGPVGCGKTALVKYLAKTTGRGPADFITVQLGDQTDSKMLLGTYRCTDIPGEFIWQPGVLTQAVTAGKWLLLEDIDSVALDVASILGNLMETGTLSVPGYRDTIQVKSGFQLFVTQRLISTASGLHRQSTGSSNLLEKHWMCVYMNSLAKDELLTIVKTLFPPLISISTRLINVFLMFYVGNCDNNESDDNQKQSLASERSISTRDLIKWCNRMIVDYDVSSPESALKVFQDAVDIFCCSLSDQVKRLNLALAIAPVLGIVKTKGEYFLNSHKPLVTIDTDSFTAGRAKLSRKIARFIQVDQSKVNFSFTRPSANLIEKIAACVLQKEPVLLVGETGTGKTSAVQFLARSTGHKLVVINMNQQSESADLLGGYKPVDIKLFITPIREEFEMLFRSYYAREPNRKFLEHVGVSYRQGKWKTLMRLMLHSTTAALKRLHEQELVIRNKRKSVSDTVESTKNNERLIRWEQLYTKLGKLQAQMKTGSSLAFAFIEGSLIKAIQEGHWVLLDEINLASSETLECLSGLLEGSSESLAILERGDSEPIKRHEDFTIFGCMNPATDVGKKELPVGLRNRFTEFFIDELTERNDLYFLINSYLENFNLSPTKIDAIVKFYLQVRREAMNSLNDGTGHKPHYSLRTLCRALSIAASNPCGNVLRSLYEAFCLSFLTQLSHQSYPAVQKMIVDVILDIKNMKSVLNMPISKPKCAFNEDYINFEDYWVIKGTLEPVVPHNYILTSSVKRNLKDLVRIVSIGKMPVLLQGDTSVGKTSLITYLAKASGHVCVRINNHEHTDLQEYVGNYVASDTGKLIFKEGILIEAMRKGYWIILDELNLAPSDVLEALNRVLDDNRELFVPETQQVIKAHSNFMLFATQNPAGLYGGRKVLSRAIRNRFVELHFDEIPPDDLQMILHERCNMPVSYCKQIISVMTELQIRRKSTAAFMGKKGFITLRDLFRWGERYRLAPNVEGLYDWSQHLADEGYLVLAAKVRQQHEANEIREVIKKHLKRDVEPNNLFSLHANTSLVTRPILEMLLKENIPGFDHIVWTYHMRRMAVLVKKSFDFKEPVLLVGETGGGKTTVCQLIAVMTNKELWSVNCHMHTESADFLGNLRPVRDHTKTDKKLFEWVDGPLIDAMKNGDVFLADEISLADDSVLERMNSLLEPERCLFLAERDTDDSADANQSDCLIKAHDNFRFIGTMNPGGDYGKKELSPALRNRFTEIWCEGCILDTDLRHIIIHNLHHSLKDNFDGIASGILHFLDVFKCSDVGKKFTVNVRDVLTWVNFINICQDNRKYSKLSLKSIFIEGARLTYLDSLGSGVTSTESREKLEKLKCSMFRSLELYSESFENCENIHDDVGTEDDDTCAKFGIDPFYIDVGVRGKCSKVNFAFNAPSTQSNALKILRALQLKKPLLLEGRPGVGKTSLVSAVADASGHNLLRINLSDQTDISDLFGADLPLEGGRGGQFAWKDGPFLCALKAGDWILLDELNLASQSVLEGLNACLDYRREIYIPELGRTFNVQPGTKIFACQNPLNQGGARRGLPKSFLNRFTQVFIDALDDSDMRIIIHQKFPNIDKNTIDKTVKFNTLIATQAGISWGHNGAPWEMNLRDITRCCELICNTFEPETVIAEAVELIYVDRMRTSDDKQKVRELFRDTFNQPMYEDKQPFTHIDEENLYFDNTVLPRTSNSFTADYNLLVLRDQIPVMKSVAQCIQMNWMSILVGRSGTGKSSVVRLLAQLTGQRLRSIVVNSEMDTTEILGGFEQTDYNRHLEEIIEQTEKLLIGVVRIKLDKKSLSQIIEFHQRLEQIRYLSSDANVSTTIAMETEIFLQRTQDLLLLISTMEIFGCSENAELALIKDKLKNLLNRVKEDNCLNAGGKFEWVDSILVKCLKDGTWLLIDQVNLCSPAILDRLNGLLEPNGVLTVGERGVDESGQIHTIKPHKNFRLFLTMDSYYGEISRAMRNRGIEIYLLGHKENKKENDLDIKSLMYNIGLTRDNHQDILLKIHRTISSTELFTDKLTTIQLLHCAFLITQQISRGFAVRQAFITSCTDVYIKSRYIHQLECKIRLMSIVESIIDEFDVTKNIPQVMDLSAVTWSTQHLQDNVQLTLISQQATLLSVFINKYLQQNEPAPHVTTKFFNDYLINLTNASRNFIDTEVLKIIPYLLLTFFEKSSINDVSLRCEWLDKFICSSTPENTQGNNNNFLMSFKDKIEEMTKEILKINHSDHPRQPWYRSTLSPSQSLSLKLHMIVMDINYPQISNCPKNKNIITVEEYSNRIYNYNLQEDNVIPLATHFVPFVASVNRWISNYLLSLSQCNSSTYMKVRQNLQWYRRFYNQGLLTFINKLKNDDCNDDYTEMNLIVHYRWLRKILLNNIEEINDDCSGSGELLAILRKFILQFDSFIDYQNSFKKLSKRVKRQLNIVRAFTTEETISGYKKLVCHTDNLLLPINNQVYQQLNFIIKHLDELREIKCDLTIIWEDIFDDKFYGASINKITNDITQFRDKYQLNPPHNAKAIYEKIFNGNSKEKLIEKSMDMVLTPLYEYSFIILAQKIHREISEKSNVENFSNETTLLNNRDILRNFKQLPNIPINLLAILNVALRKTIDNKTDCQQLLPELFRYLTQYCGVHPTRRSICNLISSLNSSFDDISEQKIHEMASGGGNSIDNIIDDKMLLNYSDNKPILINILSEYLLTNEENPNDVIVSTASLGQYKIHCEQMNIINDTLWRNSQAFNSQEYNNIVNDEKSLISYASNYLKAIENVEKNCDVYELIVGSSTNNSTSSTSLSCKNNHQLYKNCYKEPVEKLQTLIKRLDLPKNEMTSADCGLAWIYLGFHQLFLFSHLGFVDPMLKTELKLKYVNEDIEDLEMLIYTNTLDSYLTDDSGWIGRGKASRLCEAEKCLNNSYSDRCKLVKSAGYRSADVSFADLMRKVGCFRGDVGSPEHILNSAESVHRMISDLCAKNTEVNKVKLIHVARQTVETLKNRQSTWSSVLNLLDREFLANYRELVVPIMTGLSQIIHGAEMLINENNRFIANEETRYKSSTAEEFLHNFLQFPTVGSNQHDLLQLIALYTSQAGREFIKKHVDKKDNVKSVVEIFRMLKNALYELYNHVTVTRKLTLDLWDLLNGLLAQIVLIWQKQKIEMEKASAESASLYKKNTSSYGEMLSEEEQINEQLRQLFPCNRDQDFKDIDDKQPLDYYEENSVNHTDEIASCTELITENDLYEINKLHSHIVQSFMPALWIKSSHLSTDYQSPIKRNYVDPLLQRFSTFSLLRSNLEKSLSSNLSKDLYISFNVLASIAISVNSGQIFDDAVDDDDDNIHMKKIDTKPYDFYKSSNINEVKKCIPILNGLTIKIDKFLSEWPEHATLLSIRVIIARIMSFPITSAVSRFLTGLELLTDKIREWEENAHSGVSLQELSAQLIQQVINWRKLELNCWRDCLNTTFLRLKMGASKWWFYLYSLVDAHVSKTTLNEQIAREYTENVNSNEDEGVVTRKKLIELLDNFMSQSTLVEFNARLDLLLTFHTHVFYLISSNERNELLAIFWNIHQYYKVFLPDVEVKINSIRSPIERKIRDFVKIARWNDINYWSVKVAVEKSHRTILKFIREFETELNQIVSASIIIKSDNYSSAINEYRNNFIVDPDCFILCTKDSSTFADLKLKIPITDPDNFIYRSDKLLKNAKLLCKKTILMTGYPSLRCEIEEFIGEFMARSVELKNIQVDSALPKEKQKSHAKSILQQKKMALADYFRTLTSIGVSYRKGSLAWQNKQEDIVDMTVPPLDITNTFAKLSSIREMDEKILTQWLSGCEKYYHKSCVMLNSLNTSLIKIHTDLGLQNMERCRGYSVHLLIMASQQKRFLAQTINDYAALREQLACLERINFADDISNHLPTHQELFDSAHALNQLSASLLIGLEQINIYLHACPQGTDVNINERVIALATIDIAMVNAEKNDATWQQARNLIANSIKLINSITLMYDKLFTNTPMALIRTSLHFNSLKTSCESVEKIYEILGTLEMMFSGGQESHPISSAIEFLKEKITVWMRQFNGIKLIDNSDSFDNTVGERIQMKVENLIKKILLVIQEKYKSATLQNDELLNMEEEEERIPKSQDEKREDDNDNENNSILMDNGFRDKLIVSLECDIKKLQIYEVNKILQDILQELLAVNPIYSSAYNYLLAKITTILKQYLMFSQFYLTEYVDTFRITCKILYLQLNVFIDLATKGFCVPTNLDLNDEDTNDGEVERESNSGGIGLGAGEGKKDVSDRIESEDQLEDARPADEDNQDDDNNECKEEKNGIDMSDDFNGKVQDIEDNENGDDSDQNDGDDEHELDKEMGETERGADELDEELWKDDAQSDDDENKDNDDEQQGQGEKFGEKELGAKDDSRCDDHANDNEKEETKERNEMNEPDVNDDQIDPYHGKQNSQPEIEPMELPDDLNLDGENAEGKEDQIQDDQNPFDIDEMKQDVEKEKDKDDEMPTNTNEEHKDEENYSSDEKWDDATDELDVNDLDDKESSAEERQSELEQTVADKIQEENDDVNNDNDKEDNDKAVTSHGDPSRETDAANEIENNQGGTRDNVANQFNQDNKQDICEIYNENNGNDEGTGQTHSQEQNEGHSGSAVEKNAAVQRRKESRSSEKRKNPGESDENRALADDLQSNSKKLRMIQSHEEPQKKQDNENNKADDEQDSRTNLDMCQHVKDSEKFDDYAIDAATEEQVKRQKLAEENDEIKDSSENELNVDMQVDEIQIEDEMKSLNSQPIPENDDNKNKSQAKNKNNINEAAECNVDDITDSTEDYIKTSSISRPMESIFYTKTAAITIDLSDNDLSVEQKRYEVEQMLSQWNSIPSTEEALTAWNYLSTVTETPARDLSEKLRLVLEPTQASRLKGDYRTGKRINMRKIIPYIASQFRKDKIWLRRTKPSKRDYQIVLAIDDSSSMADNHSKELAFESLSLISKAMNYLEVGQLSVISFGERPRVLHPLGEPFNEASGARLIQEMQFDQKKTMIGQLVDFTVDMFNCQVGTRDNAKLLVVLSDGRGIFSEGTDCVNRAVRRAKLANIFPVFIIVENPLNKDSIFDIRMPIFESGKLLGIRSYMESFPFPFYITLSDINSMPGVLSDALKQWFEIVGKTEI